MPMRILGRQPGDRAGNAVDATADIDGDGRRDVLVGAYIDDSAAINAGAAYLVLGPWSEASYLTDAQERIHWRGGYRRRR